MTVTVSTFSGELASTRPNDVVMSQDGTRVYAVGADGALRVYDTSTGALLHTLAVSSVPLGGLDISPDGTFLIAVGLEPLEASYADPWWDNQFTAATFRIDLTNYEVTSYPITLTGEQYSLYDSAVMSDGTVLLTGQILPGGPVGLRSGCSIWQRASIRYRPRPTRRCRLFPIPHPASSRSSCPRTFLMLR